MFISHAWKSQFLDVLDALQNQHADTEVDLEDFDSWSHSFKSAIRDLSRTVMVLAPWEDVDGDGILPRG